MNFFGASSMFQTFVTWKWLEARTTHSMRSKGQLLGSRTDDFLRALECFRHAKGAWSLDLFWFKFRSSSKLFQLLSSTAFYQGRGNRFQSFYVNVSSSCMQIWKKTTVFLNLGIFRIQNHPLGIFRQFGGFFESNSQNGGFFLPQASLGSFAPPRAEETTTTNQRDTCEWKDGDKSMVVKYFLWVNY